MIVTRLAPSPTGPLHLGTARTALYSYILAKSQKGKFILRIEDTDTARSTRFFEDDIIEGIKWLGLDRDAGPDKSDEKGPYRQMERLSIYKQYVDKLIQEGKAYYAWETSEELEQMRREAKKQKKPFIYRQIQYKSEQIEKFKAEGRKPVVRFKVVPEVVEWNDVVKGKISIDMSKVGDFVIMKSDGIPTFYFANVVDDALMGVTHILRGEDHVSNTPKQIQLFKSLGFQIPKFGHLPLLLNPNKSKMSKRDTDNQFVTISKFKQEGFLPEALVNFIALLGWHPSDDREFFNINIKEKKEYFDFPKNVGDLLIEFKVEDINDSNAIYDFRRVLWFNAEYIRMMRDDVFVERLQDYLFKYGDVERKEILKVYEDKTYWLKFAPYIKVRIQTFGQFKRYCKYFFKKQFPSNELLYNKKMKVIPSLVKQILRDVVQLLQNISEEDWKEKKLKSVLLSYIKQKGLKNGQVLWPIRSILTGVEASPGAFEMLYILGKEESLKRLKDMLYVIE